MAGFRHLTTEVKRLADYFKSWLDNQTRTIFTYGAPNGFVNRDDALLTWDEPTRTLTISPAVQGGGYDVFINGKLFTKTISESIQIADTNDLHFIYFDDDGVLRTATTFDIRIFNRWAIVSTIEWSPSIQRAVPWPLNEFHGYEMDSATHIYVHNKHHTAYISGLTPTLTVDGDGTLDSHCQFSVSSGIIYDEDIPHIISAKTALDNIPVIYNNGVDAELYMDDTTPFPVLTTGTGRAAYNENVGGVFQLTEAPNDTYVLAHLVAVPGIDYTAGGFTMMMGHGYYTTKGAAREAAVVEMNQLPELYTSIIECAPVATFIIHTSDAYANSVKSVFISTDNDLPFVDFRFNDYAGMGGLTSTSWGNIIGNILSQFDLMQMLGGNTANPVIGFPSFTLATLPDPTLYADKAIVVSDATGGPCLSISTGAAWVRSDGTAL